MKFQVLDHTGHTTLEFEPDMMADAMAKFEALIKDGHVAAKKVGQGEFQQMRAMDPNVQEVVFYPQLRGG